MIISVQWKFLVRDTKTSQIYDTNEVSLHLGFFNWCHWKRKKIFTAGKKYSTTSYKKTDYDFLNFAHFLFRTVSMIPVKVKLASSASGQARCWGDIRWPWWRHRRWSLLRFRPRSCRCPCWSRRRPETKSDFRSQWCFKQSDRVFSRQVTITVHSDCPYSQKLPCL